MQKKKNVPIILNYSGRILKILIRKNDDRFRNLTHGCIVLPPLGEARVVSTEKTEEKSLFSAINVSIVGLPAPMNNTVFVVNKEVAEILYEKRKDLLTFVSLFEESTQSSLKPEEKMVVTNDLYGVYVDY